MLKISQLNAGYGDLHVLFNVDLFVETGQVAVLMGPNGAGKSTLLKTVFNLMPVETGKIFFNDEPSLGLPTSALLAKGITYVPQGKVNFGRLTVRENLLMGGYHLKNRKVLQKNLENIFSEFPVLAEKKSEYAFRLSGGQQQTLALARALMLVPKLLLLDEPSLGLSPKLVRETFAKIRQINQTFGTTVLIVEHNIKSVLTIADYGFVMVEGRIVASDTAENLKQSGVLQKVFVGAIE